MLRKEKNGVVWLEFAIFQQFPSLRQGVFLRHGGESQGHLSSLNLSYHVADDPLSVSANEGKLLSILNIPKLIRAQLVHGKEIVSINSTEQKLNNPCDGLTTRKLNLGLMVTHADCQAAIFYDPITHSLATVHAGWRGQVHNIYAETIAMMKNEFGAAAANIHVGISPSLGPEAAEFMHYKTELPPLFWKYQVKPNYFDFWEISRMQLQGAGILKEHIEIAGICTYSNPQDYFSYRRDKQTGRHATVAALL